MTRLVLAAALGLAATAGGQQPPPSPFAPPGQQMPPPAQPPQGQPGQPAPLPPGAEVLARGPVHESFAEPAFGKVSATPVVPKPPPPPIEELPPDQRPEGNVEWVAGYWHWDDERNDYIWVSGCWRDDPPGRDWLPGRWEQVQGGFHWVSGCWVPEGQDQVQLLPQPPAPPDEPQAQARPPWPGMKFVPGTWVWQQTQYVWRPGKWIREPADWVYQAASYVWTPGGYIFTDGYWDRPLRTRGLLFAPTAFPAQLVTTRKVTFEPQYAVPSEFLEGALFVRTTSKHYYFGDFFEPKYQQAGFVPWTDYRVSGQVADPLFAHYKLYNPAPNWEVKVRALYTERYAGRAPRPPRTLVAQQQYVRTVVRQQAGPAFVPPPEVRQVVALAPVQQVASYGVRTTRVVQEQRVQYQQFAQQRVQVASAYQEQAFRRVKEEHQGRAWVPPTPYAVKIKTVTRSKVIARQPAPVPLPPPPSFQIQVNVGR